MGAHISGGQVGGVAVENLNQTEARMRAYSALVAQDLARADPTNAEVETRLAAHQFIEVFNEPSQPVTTAASKALDNILLKVGAN